MSRYGFIVKRELKAYLISPLAYITAAIFLIINSWFFFSVFFFAGVADMRSFFELLPIVYTFILPALTMHIFSEEYKSGSFEILATQPVTIKQIIIEKYLGTLAFATLLLVLTFTYPIAISVVGSLDWGPVIGGYLGALLFSSSYVAIGVLVSSFTKNQIIAYIVTAAICFFLTMLDLFVTFMPGAIRTLLQYFSSRYHFSNIAKGVIDTRDVAYFITITVAALYATYIVNTEKR